MESEKMKDKLKPCPFCGGKAKVIEEYDCMIGKNAYFIECCNCRATFYNGNANKNKEIEKWNRRVNKNE